MLTNGTGDSSRRNARIVGEQFLQHGGEINNDKARWRADASATYAS